MSDREIELISMWLDIICEKIYKRAKPLGVYKPDAWHDYSIRDKVDLLMKMANDIWDLEIKLNIQERNLKCTSESYLKKIKDLEMDKEQLAKQWERSVELSGNLEMRLNEYRAKAHIEPRTKKGNQNAARKDIDPLTVYRLVESGMSKTKVAEQYNASRATIRKYYIAGKKECSRNED